MLKFYVFQVSHQKLDLGKKEPILGGSHELYGVTNPL